jgi:predicted DNA-binding transcriptional regulator AlpA
MNVENNRLLNSQEAARLLGLSISHFRRLYRAGRLPKPVRIGVRKCAFRQGDLLAAIEARRAA